MGNMVPLKLNPGVDVDKTPLLAEAQWTDCNHIRFKDGLLQKLGGWIPLLSQTLNGVCRGMFAWEDESSNQYMVFGTNKQLAIYNDGSLYDVTPVANTRNLTGPFTTTSGSSIVTITDSTNTISAGDSINIVNTTTLNGVVLHGNYISLEDSTSNQYTIDCGQLATSSGSGGSVAEYTTTTGSNIVDVVLPYHGFSVGGSYNSSIPTTVGGITINGSYIVTQVVNSSEFKFQAGTSATSSATAYENNNKTQIEYLLAIGYDSSGTGTNYGDGVYGQDYYGFSDFSTQRARQWFFGNWGQDFVCSYTGGGVYFWDVSGGLSNNPASIISQAPSKINSGIFTAMPQDMIVALGASISSGELDPLLVRWCDVQDFTDWTASSTNQAGSFHLGRGSRIVGGLQAPNTAFIWTDVGLWTMDYVSYPYVWSFHEIGQGCGLINAKAAGSMGASIFWLSQENFFRRDGGAPTIIPCPIWDKIFNGINRPQLDKIFCAPNSYFNEVSWFYPSLNGDGEIDSYVKYNIKDGLWDYGSLSITAWIDQTSFGPPMSVATDGTIYQHELGNGDVLSYNAGSQAMDSYAETGWFEISDGDSFLFIERMLPDFKFLAGTVNITVTTQDYSGSGSAVRINTYGPYTVTEGQQYVRIRARGRMAKIRIESNDLDSFWRLGKIVFYTSQMGSR